MRQSRKYWYKIYIWNIVPPIPDNHAGVAPLCEIRVTPPDTRFLGWPFPWLSRSRQLCQPAGRGSNAGPDAGGVGKSSCLSKQFNQLNQWIYTFDPLSMLWSSCLARLIVTLYFFNISRVFLFKIQQQRTVHHWVIDLYCILCQKVATCI